VTEADDKETENGLGSPIGKICLSPDDEEVATLTFCTSVASLPGAVRNFSLTKALKSLPWKSSGIVLGAWPTLTPAVRMLPASTVW
jgi:hypothetical protein